MARPDYYHILGITASADPAAVKQAFRAKAKKCHPDLNPGPGATEQFMRLNEAYEIISDPHKRRMYDLSLRSPAAPPKPSAPSQADAQYQAWVAQAQARARHYARMDYQQFHKNRFEKAEARVFGYMQYLLIATMFILGLLCMALPIAAFLLVDWKGIFLAIVCVPGALKVLNTSLAAYRDLREYLAA